MVIPQRSAVVCPITEAVGWGTILNDVLFFARPNCPLCDHAKEVLVDAGVAFDEIDITTDPALEQEFGTVIPVVELKGVRVFEAGMDPLELAKLGSERGPGLEE